MRYYRSTIVGLGLCAASLTTLFLALPNILRVFLELDSCVNGGPYVVANPCPPGFEKSIAVVTVFIWPMMLGTAIWARRANHPDGHAGLGNARLFSNTIIWPALPFVLGAVCVYSVLKFDVNPDLITAEILIIVFAVLCFASGIALLVFSGIWKSGHGNAQGRQPFTAKDRLKAQKMGLPVTVTAQTAPEPATALMMSVDDSDKPLRILVSLATVAASVYGTYHLLG